MFFWSRQCDHVLVALIFSQTISVRSSQIIGIVQLCKLLESHEIISLKLFPFTLIRAGQNSIRLLIIFLAIMSHFPLLCLFDIRSIYK